MKLNKLILCFFALLLIVGCRGYKSEKTPFHLNPNMDHQAKFKAQAFSQHPPEGTLPKGYRQSSTEVGRNFTGAYVSKMPVTVTAKLLDRGQERYDIYCAVCHDKVGSGKSIVVKRGFLPPPNLSDKRLKKAADGYLFDVITNGVRNMPAYRKQIPVADRWAIVAYVRALQNASGVPAYKLDDSVRVKIKE